MNAKKLAVKRTAIIGVTALFGIGVAIGTAQAVGETTDKTQYCGQIVGADNDREPAGAAAPATTDAPHAPDEQAPSVLVVEAEAVPDAPGEYHGEKPVNK